MDRKSHTLSPDWNTGHSDVIEKSRHGGVHHSKVTKKREKKEYREDKMEHMRKMKGYSKKK